MVHLPITFGQILMTSTFTPLPTVVRQGLILSIAINSARHGLLALLIGSNFYEVK